MGDARFARGGLSSHPPMGEILAIDRVRGDASRGEWLRALAADAVMAHDTLTGPVVACA